MGRGCREQQMEVGPSIHFSPLYVQPNTQHSVGTGPSFSQVPKKLRGPYSCCIRVTNSTASPTVSEPSAMPCGWVGG